MSALLKGNPSRLQTLLFWLHTALYALIWLGAFIHSLTRYTMGSPSLFSFMLLWSLVYILHTRSYMQLKGRSQGSDERQAYRDGYQDAMREITSARVDPRQLMLDDDGEFAEEAAYALEKRKRR